MQDACIFRRIKDHSFSRCAKYSEKLTFSYSLILTRTCVYQWVRNISLTETFSVKSANLVKSFKVVFLNNCGVQLTKKIVKKTLYFIPPC